MYLCACEFMRMSDCDVSECASVRVSGVLVYVSV